MIGLAWNTQQCAEEAGRVIGWVRLLGRELSWTGVPQLAEQGELVPEAQGPFVSSNGPTLLRAGQVRALCIAFFQLLFRVPMLR